MERYAQAVLAYWLGAVDKTAVHASRIALSMRTDTSRQSVTNRSTALAFLDGMVAYTDRNAGGIDSARSELRSSTHPAAPYLERALAAFKLELDGQRAEAADSLAGAEWERARHAGWVDYPVPFIRIAAGRWKAENGAAASADSLLSFYETSSAALPTQRFLKAPAALAAFERARAWDKAGDRSRAARYYRDFLRLYDLPPPQHRQYVTEAEAALARLAGVSDRPKGQSK
jgi:hypothetical protein